MAEQAALPEHDLREGVGRTAAQLCEWVVDGSGPMPSVRETLHLGHLTIPELPPGMLRAERFAQTGALLHMADRGVPPQSNDSLFVGDAYNSNYRHGLASSPTIATDDLHSQLYHDTRATLRGRREELLTLRRAQSIADAHDQLSTIDPATAANLKPPTSAIALEGGDGPMELEKFLGLMGRLQSEVPVCADMKESTFLKLCHDLGERLLIPRASTNVWHLQRNGKLLVKHWDVVDLTGVEIEERRGKFFLGLGQQTVPDRSVPPPTHLPTLRCAAGLVLPPYHESFLQRFAHSTINAANQRAKHS